MKAFDFITRLEKDLQQAKDGNVFGQWVFRGVTDKAHGTPGGSWDTKIFPGYLFSNQKGDKSFIIRPVAKKDGPAIAIESMHTHSQLINYGLSTRAEFEDLGTETVIKDNGNMTVNPFGRANRDLAYKFLFENGLSQDKVFFRANDAKYNSNEAVDAILKWSEVRENTKRELKEYLKKKKTVVLDPASGTGSLILPEKKKYPLNQILFGPPGTGKTYNSIPRAVEIADTDFFENYIGKKEFSEKEWDEIKDRFDELVEEEQIVFTTFHQSMSYEDFIEGIKPILIQDKEENPVVTYEVKPGIFKKICEAASRTSSFEEAYQQYVEDVIDKGSIQLKTLAQGKKFNVKMNSNRNSSVTADTSFATPMVVTKEMVRSYVVDGKIIDWKPYTPAIGEHLKKEYNLNVEATDNRDKNFVLIIDEINRGNVSQIFGELITLIEDTKRTGAKEELHIKLPYSKAPFSVPPNLHILGTMNTADRSVEAMDTAIRRRFHFEEVKTDSSLLSPKNIILHLWNVPAYFNMEWDEAPFFDRASVLYDFLGVSNEIEGIADKINNRQGPKQELWNEQYIPNLIMTGGLAINLQLMLNAINKRIEKLLSSDNQIGHAYFICIRDSQNPIAELRKIFKNKIIPLLQEYFYGDYGKIGLVLGKDFFEALPSTDNNDKFFAPFFNEYDNGDELAERVVWKLKELDKMDDGVFKQAIINIYTPTN